METKKLYRSKKDKMFAGICGGLGEYSEMDSNVIRLIWLTITIFTGAFPGILVYLIAILIIPRHSEAASEVKTEVPGSKEESK